MWISKVNEFIGSSPESFEDAARQVVERANRTLRGITGIEGRDKTAQDEGGGRWLWNGICREFANPKEIPVGVGSGKSAGTPDHPDPVDAVGDAFRLKVMTAPSANR